MLQTHRPSSPPQAQLTLVPALRSEIMAMQDGLRALLSRVTSVKEDCTKAEADNEMLQTYIDSVTKSLAAKERG